MIDTHAHLNFKAFKDDYEQVIKRAQKAGVEAIINVGSNLETSEKAVELAEKFDCCYAAVGIHPIHALEAIREIGEIGKRLRNIARQKKVVAVGETGLDYYRNQTQNASASPRRPVLDRTRSGSRGRAKLKTQNDNLKLKAKEVQKELFKLHIELAQELKLPLIIHNREAHEDILSILQSTINNQPSTIQAVFHCFSGTKNFLKQVLGMNFYVGFDGNVTYKSADNLRELVIATPLSRLLLETDCPYLAPEPLRDTKNEPKNVKIIGEFVANLKSIDFNRLKQVTTENAKTLFKI